MFLPALIVGLGSLGFGLRVLTRPRRMARLSVRLEAIGADGWSALEPTDWYVAATALVGVAFVGLGLFGVAFGLAPGAVADLLGSP